MINYIKKSFVLALMMSLGTSGFTSLACAADKDDISCWDKQACCGYTRGQWAVLVLAATVVVTPIVAILGSIPGANAESLNDDTDDGSLYGGEPTYHGREQFIRALPRGCDSDVSKQVQDFKSQATSSDPLRNMPINSVATLYQTIQNSDGAIAHVTAHHTEKGTSSKTEIFLSSEDSAHETLEVKLNPQGVPTSVKRRKVPHSDYERGIDNDGKITVVTKGNPLKACYNFFDLNQEKKKDKYA